MCGDCKSCNAPSELADVQAQPYQFVKRVYSILSSISDHCSAGWHTALPISCCAEVRKCILQLQPLPSISTDALSAPNHLCLQAVEQLHTHAIDYTHSSSKQLDKDISTSRVSSASHADLFQQMRPDLVKASCDLLDCGPIPYLRHLYFRGEWQCWQQLGCQQKALWGAGSASTLYKLHEHLALIDRVHALVNLINHTERTHCHILQPSRQ